MTLHPDAIVTASDRMACIERRLACIERLLAAVQMVARSTALDESNPELPLADAMDVIASVHEALEQEVRGVCTAKARELTARMVTR